MRLTLGARSHDLSGRALVLGALGAPGDAVAEGADLVEPGHPGRWGALPVCATAWDEPGLERALAAHAALVRLQAPTPATLRRCAAAGVAVIVPPAALEEARAADLPADRVVSSALVLDVTGERWPTAATAVGVIRGARIVRTADVHGARRICDVLAAVLAAR